MFVRGKRLTRVRAADLLPRAIAPENTAYWAKGVYRDRLKQLMLKAPEHFGNWFFCRRSVEAVAPEKADQIFTQMGMRWEKREGCGFVVVNNPMQVMRAFADAVESAGLLPQIILSAHSYVPRNPNFAAAVRWIRDNDPEALRFPSRSSAALSPAVLRAQMALLPGIFGWRPLQVWLAYNSNLGSPEDLLSYAGARAHDGIKAWQLARYLETINAAGPVVVWAGDTFPRNPGLARLAGDLDGRASLFDCPTYEAANKTYEVVKRRAMATFKKWRVRNGEELVAFAGRLRGVVDSKFFLKCVWFDIQAEDLGNECMADADLLEVWGMSASEVERQLAQLDWQTRRMAAYSAFETTVRFGVVTEAATQVKQILAARPFWQRW